MNRLPPALKSVLKPIRKKAMHAQKMCRLRAKGAKMRHIRCREGVKVAAAVTLMDAPREEVIVQWIDENTHEIFAGLTPLQVNQYRADITQKITRLVQSKYAAQLKVMKLN